MRRVDPGQRHFAHFLAESHTSTGEYNAAIDILVAWFDLFLSKAETNCNVHFIASFIAIYLDDAIKFDLELSEVIEFWRSSLKKCPPTSIGDAHQTCLARSLLVYSCQRPSDEALDTLKLAVALCPDQEGHPSFTKAFMF